MKDIFNRRQRFSLRKYSIGVCSVLLGTALFAAGAQSASADEATAASGPAETAASETQPAATESSQTEAPGASPVYGEGAPALKVDLPNSAATPEAPAPATEKAEVAETPAATENKEAKAEEAAKPAKAETKKSEEAPKTTASSETSKPVEKKKESSSKPASTTAATTAQPTATPAAAGESSERAAAREEAATPAGTTTFSATVSSAAPITGTQAESSASTGADTAVAVANANAERTNAGALAISGRRRSRRAVTNEAVSGDHNSNPVAVSTYLKDGEKVTPEIRDANGATVSSQPVPAGYARKEGDWYTYAIWDLTEFNKRYSRNYYARAYKRFDESTDTTVELLDKGTGNVLETRTITSSSGVQKFTTTTSASNSELTFQVDYKAGIGDKGKAAQPFIQNGYEVGSSITRLVAPGHQLTPAEQALYTAVYNARTTTDILNVVEPAYNGRTITDSNAKIPETINKTTYYKVVDKNNPTFNANKTDKTVQDYKENGNEVDLARYTLKAEEGQSFTASGERQFDGYKLYQTADANDKSGYVSRPYTVGTKFMDADRYGIKRIKEVVGEDGSVVVRVYLLDPKQQSKRSDGTLDTDGYMLLAETKPIKPGDWNSQELAVKKTPLYTIPHTATDPKTGVKTEYPNGKEIEFDFYKGSDMPPYHAVFVPFLGDNIGYKIDNAQLERGIYGSGIKVDLANSLTPYKQPVYYYVKQEPVEVTPEVGKQLEGRVLANGEFTFKLKEVQPNKSLPAHEETVTNKADGKATFSKLTFNKVGTYTYTITETPGSDANVEYDAMTVTMTVTVTENAQGELQAAVKYSAEGGFKSSADDKVFNNYVVAPVKTKFDFTKKLAGRELKDGEFKFVLKDANGQEVETVTNKADGTVTFTELSFDNSKVGTHTYTVEEVVPAAKEAGMVYDTMKATITVEVAKNGHTLTTVTNVVSTGGVDANGKATDGTADKEFNNKITPPETPEFQPEKFVLNKEKFDLTGTKLMDDDDELQDEYTETNANPYADQTKNNEAENINTKTVNRGDKLVYQVWLDTKNFTDKNNIQSVGISDTYDADKLTVNSADIKAYDSETGVDVTSKFDITVSNGVITATSKSSMNKSLGDADNTQVIDTTKFAFGRYYKFDIPATVKESVAGGVDIENKANQIVHVYNPVSKSVETPEKPTQKRVNSVPITAEFNFTKRLEGRALKAGEFTFELKDSDNVVIATVTNDADGKIKFSPVEYTNKAGEKVTALKYKKGQEGTYTYSVTEVKGADATVTYDTMKAEVTVTVSHDGTAKALIANVTEPADKEFNNTVTPPTEPKFQPEKYVVSKEKYDITGDKLVDDDRELADKYADTNANPYADDASNNEAENLNTKTVERGSKLVYQVWLDTTKFDAANKGNIQTVGISDNYDEAKLNLNKADIKAYDSVTGAEVTDKFDITVNNGVITANLKAGFTKSLGDAENTQVIDTTKFAFGRYYKFDIPTTVKDDVVAGADIENTAAQVVNYYNPTTKKVEKPEKPTEKRVNNVPISVEFNFTKKLEGRDLKAGEFTFELKDSDNVVIATATNDESGNFKFTPVDYTNKAGKTVTALKYQKGQEGTYTYTVTEVKGTDSTVTYDEMAAVVTVKVSHDGTAKALITNVTDPADKEFNNKVTPPTEPKFQPEKYVVSKAKFDITGTKLVDDDSELTDKYGETNTNPYVDGTSNNEDENLNTKTVERGSKLYYQVWLDTTKFDANNKDNIQTVGITDNYDKDKLTVNASDIKVYDSVTGADVTTKFDIADNNGVLIANLKDGFTKSLGDAENTQIIDTTKFEFGRYYKFDIPATVKDDVAAGADIENKAAQVVNYYNPVSKTVEKPNKPTEKRVNSVPISVEFNFTKKLEGRDLKAGEFTFELKDSDNVVIATATNDKAGKIKFAPVDYTNKAGETVTALKYQKGQEGTYKYTVEEVKGSDATVTYDTMKAVVTVEVRHDGTAKALITNVTDPADKEFNNTVRPPEEPKFQPEKYVVSEEKFDITGDKLVDDDKELADKYADTNANPYADDASNNEKQNLNTKTVKRGDKLVYQVWLDTTKFDAANKDNIQSVGISDDYDETKLDLDSTKIKAYDSVTGDDVTAKFDIAVNNGVITATLKDGFTKSLGDAENTQVIDTTKFAFGRYYKFDIPTTVKQTVKAGVDIENTAAQVVNYYNPTTKKVETPEKPTQKRVNNVPVPVEFNFTKRLEGRELKANEFSFVLKDSEGKTLETVSNDASGNVKFSALEFKKGQEGVHNYTVEEVKGSDATVTYDTMKANVTVTVKHDGTAKVLVATVGDIADKEFNNRVTPPEEPKFQPEKYVVSEEKFDITGDKLVDDDKELADKYADTNANPYADDASNNEKQNLNTKTVKRGDKLVYQVWLDTTKFDATNKDNIQSVGISDDYDETKLELDSTKIKAYDSVTGAEVTDKFDIAVNNGVITATLKDGFTKSLGDAENTQIIDTTKFEFGRYYKFDIPTTVKADVPGGVDIENTAAQVVNYYNPTTKKVEKPSKPTEKRVNNVPVEVEFNFTKRLEGRELKANEFSFVLKDSTGKEVETVSNDASGNVKFKALEFKKGDEGVHNYTVEEVKGSDATVTYDTMKANVTVTVSHDGTAKVLIATVGDIADKEFNNRVTPPETPEFNPEKYVLNEKEFDLTGTSLLDDDKELADKYADTNANPYADDASNNEAANINTKSVKPGEKLVYQVWLDTTKFDANNKDHIQSVGISDDYDEAKVDVEASAIKAYDGKTGADVTAKFDIAVNNGVITATLKDGFTKSLGDAENTQVIDTTKFEFGRYYKFDIPATVKADVKGGVDIENTAAQVVNYYNPVSKTVEKPNKPTEKRVNSVPVQVEFNFTKRLEGRELKANEFSFVLKDSTGKVVETVSNDASGNVKFSKLEFKKEQVGEHKFTVEEVKGTDGTVTYDAMKAVVTVEVKHDGTAKALITNVTDPADKEFNNRVTPPETPEFNPEKYILNESKFDLTGVKLLDDDNELEHKVADTNANPYADGTANNEAQNINTKTLKKGDKVYYQVWLDTTKFTEAHNIQSVGVTDKYDSANLTVNGADIKAYDSVTGEDVTAKFDIKVENGVITATSKADLTKSLGDAENTQVIDTTKLAFGRYYKFEIPAEIKQSAQDGVDIENTASQIVHQYDPTKKTVEKPEKPTEKRVVNIPVKVQFQFTKKLEGRALKAGEFSFVLKDEKGNVIETVTNDAAGKITFSNLEFKRGEEGTHLYHVEEIRGTDSSIEYDKMVATVGIMINKDGKVLTAITQLPEDTEFNNTVIPPTTPPNTPPTTPPNTPPTTPPNTPPTTPPNTPPTPPTTPPTPPTPPTPTTPPAPALPETGEEQSASAALLGAALGMVGLAGLAKRKKRED